MREDEGLEGGNKWLPYGLLAGFTHTLTIHHFASTWSYKNNFLIISK